MRSNRDRRRMRSAALLMLAALGCRSTGTASKPGPSPKPESPPRLDATAGIKADPGLIRAGFEAKARPGQEVGVHMEMGRGHESRGQLEAAAVDFQKAIDALDRPGRREESGRAVAADKAIAHRKLARVLDGLGRFAQSDAHYRAALKLAPDDPKVWNDAGYSLYIQGQFEPAERSLRTAARLAPDDPRVATNLGLALAAGGKLDESYKVLTKAGGEAAAHANIGYVLASTGRRDEAADHYRRALALQPGLEVATTALAKLGAPEVGSIATLPPLPADPAVGRASGSAR